VFARFTEPVRKANTVPSILLGVILAKRAIVGKTYIARLVTPNKVSVIRMKAISFIPTYRFSLRAKAKLAMLYRIEKIVA